MIASQSHWCAILWRSASEEELVQHVLSADQVVFRDKLVEFRSGQSVVPPVNEIDKEEDVTLSVIEVDSAGSSLVRHGLQEQNASWHFDPACGYGLAYIQENLDDVLDARILAQADIVGCK